MKTILVGVDFSKSSKNTMEYATMLAEHTKSQIHLFHAIATPVVHTNSGMYFTAVDYLDKEVRQRLREFKKQMQQQHPSIKFEASFTYNGLRSEIDDLVKRRKVHVVVLGHETKSKLEKFIYGSTSAELMGKLDCPIITVPEKYDAEELKKVIVCVDNHGTIDAGLSRRIHEMVKFLGLEAKYVHIKTDDELLVEKNPNKSIKVESFPAKDFISGIKKYAKRENADMIMVLSRHHNVFYSLLMDSHSRKLIEKADVPVISIHH